MRSNNLNIMSYPIVINNPVGGVEVVGAAEDVEAAAAVVTVKAIRTRKEAPSTKIKITEATSTMEASADIPKATTEIDVHTKIEVEREGRAHPV